MAYEFQKLSEVEVLTEVPEGASVLAEVNGDIKRVPGTGLGGNGGIKTAIIKSSDYDNALVGLTGGQMSETNDTVTYTCVNMTFDEAYQILASGEPLSVICMTLHNMAPVVITSSIGFMGDAIFGVPCINIDLSAVFSGQVVSFANVFWTDSGISTKSPLGDK